MTNPWSLYQRQPAFVLGFHGTDRSVVNGTVSRAIKHLDKSEDTTEWLGHGFHFWENDPARALEWARTGKTKGRIEASDAVGAVIDLGFCLDLTTMTGLAEVTTAFEAQVHQSGARRAPHFFHPPRTAGRYEGFRTKAG